MGRKNKLLSIGEMSKLTGASLRSLRYYEKLNLLKLAYIDPDSGYRYFSFDQANHVEMIQFCIELDILLKELTKFSHADDTMDFRAFLAQGKQIAEDKQRKIRRGLRLIHHLEENLNLADLYQPGQIYEREIPEKYVHAKPCGGVLKDLDLFEMVMLFADMPYADVGYDELSEYGFLCEQNPARAQYFVFAEVPKRMANKTIPAGRYVCCQNENPQIENARAVFKEQRTSEFFLAIETEIFTDRHKINKPLNELRVCTAAHALTSRHKQND